MDDDECPVCEHTWDLHPGVNPWLNVCGMCVAEEDHGERTYQDMCTLEPLAASQPLPAGRLRARLTRRLLGGYRVVIEDWQRQRWTILTPEPNTQESAEQLVAAVEADLASMTLKALRERYLSTLR